MQCPACNSKLFTTTVNGIAVEMCTACSGIWFDRNELKDYLLASGREDHPGARTALPRFQNDTRKGFCPKCNRVVEPWPIGRSGVSVLKCRQCGGFFVTLEQLDSMELWFPRATPMESNDLCDRGPHDENRIVLFGESDSFVKSMAGVKEDENPVKNVPFATLGIIAVNVLVAVLVNCFPGLFQKLWLIPGDLWGNFGKYYSCLLTCMFVHGSAGHLLGNMYFLWVFGDNVEDRVGAITYVAYYLLMGLVSSIAYALVYHASGVPVLGSSGAISGLMGAYLYLYPKTKINIYYLVFRSLAFKATMPVWLFLGGWFVMQGVFLLLGTTGTAWVCHIAGFLFGLLAMMLIRRLDLL